MDVVTLLSANALSNAIGKLIYDILYVWVRGWSDGWSLVGAFSVTVILFTVFLKILLFPLDYWQKHLGRKNAHIMEQMKPALDKVTKQCGNNKEMLMQKQRAVYKEYKYSPFKSCLPMVLTLAVFFIILGGFNSAVAMHNKNIYTGLEKEYDTAFYSKMDEYVADGVLEKHTGESGVYYTLLDEDNYTMAGVRSTAMSVAEQAVINNFKSEKFLLTKNIFVADTWKNPVPTASEFTGSGFGSSAIDVDPGKYEIVMRKLMEENNDDWNGYLILPAVAFLLNFFSMKLNKMPDQPQVAGQSDEQKKQQQASAKMMQFMMPIMMLVFALFYSAAFTLYMLISSLWTTVFNLVYNIITKRIDEKEKDRLMSITVK